jgi:hypothetical protein
MCIIDQFDENASLRNTSLKRLFWGSFRLNGDAYFDKGGEVPDVNS